ncbi:HD domain-containing protein [Brevundimonas viscosa]|uniref:HD domain-containing protein n=1 Tax=Brevundimonas viscosa TaxID=871741 RepID=A0A1I6SH14_9CAUL|nr:HD domain-containing protein [Brevundimonas viscosa]SFS76246.1 uncharacterized protein SAMN05192570_2411 [Brevundimonas viscosa]
MVSRGLRRRILLMACAWAALLGGPAFAQQAAGPSASSPAGIPAAAPWRAAVLAHAMEHFQHPGWGWRHSERDYLLAMAVAEAEGLAVDPDVIFAAAFLHDWGGIEPFAAPGVDHAERSVELAEPFLREAGFPMDKFPAVRAAILGHMYDREPEGPEAVALHDADLLDFLGATGAARMLAVTGERPDYDQALGRIERFAAELPDQLKTSAAREMAAPRVAAMTAFLEALRREVPAGAKP